MPIKFRCNYCRQFLGISRAQAGGVVDCPTCGRSIRVPLLDGTVQPLPTPELNLQDAHLARALDELAQLGDLIDQPVGAKPVAGAKVSAMGFMRESDDDGDDDANQIPQPIPEPIPIEVPIAPTPVPLEPPVQALDPPGGDIVAEPRSAGVNSSRANDRERSLFAELASLAPPPIVASGSAAVAQEPMSIRLGDDGLRPGSHLDEQPALNRRPMSSSTYSLSKMMAIAGLFLSGMFVERFVRVLESLSTPAVSSVTAPVIEQPQAGGLSGRITFKSAEGESKPDRGARLILFPEERPGEVKLPLIGFRPSDGEADTRVAAAAMKALGGAVATVDESGRFEIDLPAGSYRVLVLSRFQSRDEKLPIDPALLKQLAAYIEKPAELLGLTQFHFAPLRVKGTGDIWDHSF
jgi:hypothetical protein